MKEKIEIIKKFAKTMNYKIRECNYLKNDRPVYSIAIIGLYNSKQEIFVREWYLDNETEIQYN